MNHQLPMKPSDFAKFFAHPKPQVSEPSKQQSDDEWNIAFYSGLAVMVIFIAALQIYTRDVLDHPTRFSQFSPSDSNCILPALPSKKKQQKNETDEQQSTNV